MEKEIENDPEKRKEELLELLIERKNKPGLSESEYVRIKNNLRKELIRSSNEGNEHCQWRMQKELEYWRKRRSLERKLKRVKKVNNIYWTSKIEGEIRKWKRKYNWFGIESKRKYKEIEEWSERVEHAIHILDTKEKYRRDRDIEIEKRMKSLNIYKVEF